MTIDKADGVIDRAEFSAPSLAMFHDLDRNGDGVLSADAIAKLYNFGARPVPTASAVKSLP